MSVYSNYSTLKLLMSWETQNSVPTTRGNNVPDEATWHFNYSRLRISHAVCYKCTQHKERLFTLLVEMKIFWYLKTDWMLPTFMNLTLPLLFPQRCCRTEKSVMKLSLVVLVDHFETVSSNAVWLCFILHKESPSSMWRRYCQRISNARAHPSQSVVLD